ncbi:uncharacterized protein LOC125006372 isoform X1 [Mugil cephalus]|uniref:uncharacterized protein LOC125006372 isoform X1 n=2 Tax=Mugil cephalus TaxID=48193 RepID=UPI001FB5A95D|nr:uncharacterized protein LOC125006372 isoform X1 [Mugil cephalus]XP_047438294.1 uncharacterized protein LOC125006372 isoform X1 [Mugil cephalus]XP_047438295.1 uncharacterized protein LOC125006372 isoform X1 [Mugil cephalus]
MAGNLQLLILMCFFLELKAQDLPPPNLTVNQQEIEDTDSVFLNCQTPSSVSVSDCYFNFLRDKVTKSFSCLKTLSGTELLSLVQQRSPATVEVTCSYMRVHQSEHSNMLTITIQTPQPKLTVTPQLITETESVALICQTPSSVSVSQCFLIFMRKTTSRAVSCLKTLTGTELLSMSQQSSPAEVEVTCYYTVERRGEHHPSPQSNRASISILKLTDTSPSTTTQEMTTQTITSFRMTTGQTVTMSRSSFGSLSTSLKETVSRGTTRPGTGALTLGLFPVTTPEASSDLWMWKLVVVVLGFGVTVGFILLGVVLVHIKRRSGKYSDKRLQASVTGESVNMTSVDPGELLPAGNIESYHVISSLPGANYPTGGFDQITGHSCENEKSEVYHVYDVIPEEPAAVALDSNAYSTVMKH